MNAVIIILPILTLLMFDLGLTLKFNDFLFFIQRPRPVIVGLLGQIVVLPAVAFSLACLFSLPPAFFIGIMLIACCPGGSSSNIFSMLVGGDVALSVSLTACSSIITLFTLPLIMSLTMGVVDYMHIAVIELPVKNLIIQNLLLMLLPIMLGLFIRHCKPVMAGKIEKQLSKIAFPALIVLAGIFFIQHYHTIKENMLLLGGCIMLLLLSTIVAACIMSRISKLQRREERTIIIEVGMQNAAQAIAVASSPFIFNDNVIAIPAIIYALLMNVVLLLYVGINRRKDRAIR